MEAIEAERAGRAAGRWLLVPQGGGETSLWCDHGDEGDGLTLARRAEAVCRAHGWFLVARFDGAARPALRAAAAELGWARRGARVAWVHPVERLPDDAGTPLTWLSSQKLDPDIVSGVLAGAVVDDPVRPVVGSPATWLAGWLAAPRLEGVVQVGLLDGVPVAISGGQVDPTTGAGRIPYAGMVPAVRGRGLGRWLLRRGFHLLRARGATTWSDTTGAANHRMLAVLRTWRIQPGPELDEWLFDPGVGAELAGRAAPGWARP